jgi:hypothetical protein
MWVPSTSRDLIVDWRRAFIPISLGALLLVWLAARPPFWVMLILACVLPAALTVGAVLVSREKPAFDKEFSRLLQREDAPGLHALLRRLRALRWFGPPGFLDEKRGLVASLEGDWALADKYLERAYVRSDANTQKALLPAVLRAKFESGVYDEAETIARDLLGKTRYPGTPELFLGLILAQRDETRQDAKRLLERAAETLGGSDRERAEAAIKAIVPAKGKGTRRAKTDPAAA